MGFSITAGTRFYVGGETKVVSLQAFQADTYVEVREVESFGEIGDGAANYEAIDPRTARTIRLKRAYDGGVLAVVAADDMDDAGQIALHEARHDKFIDDVNFRIDLPQDDTIHSFYFSGSVLGVRRSPRGVNDVRTVTFSIAVNTELMSTV